MRPVIGRFPSRPPYSVLSADHFTEAYSRARNRRLQELASGRRLAAADLQKILADPGVANAGTVVSTVFDPAEPSWVARGETPPVNQGPFVAKIMGMTAPERPPYLGRILWSLASLAPSALTGGLNLI